MEFLNEYYNGILSFHIIAVLSWMSVVFYMPRLFVYHAQNIDKKDFVEVVKIRTYAPVYESSLLS